MRVTANQDFTFFHNHAPVAISAGDRIESDLAALLLARGAAVTPDDDEADAVAGTPGGDPSGDGEPTGGAPGSLSGCTSAAQVAAWVGTDPARAAEALDAENARGGQARSTLVKTVTKLAAAT